MTTDTIPPALAALATALLADAETVDLLRDVDRASDECEAESPRVLPLLRSLAELANPSALSPSPAREAAPVAVGLVGELEALTDAWTTGPVREPYTARRMCALDVRAILTRHRAPVEATREATRTIAAIAEDVLACADSWAPGARLIGNVRADEVARLARYSAVCAAAPTTPPPPGPLSDEELTSVARIAARASLKAGEGPIHAEAAARRAVATAATAPLRAELERLGIQAQDALDRAVKRTRAEERRIADDFATRATEAEAEVTRLRAGATSDAPDAWAVWHDGSALSVYGREASAHDALNQIRRVQDATRCEVVPLYRAPVKDDGGGLTVGAAVPADLAGLLREQRRLTRAVHADVEDEEVREVWHNAIADVNRWTRDNLKEPTVPLTTMEKP